jgi:hypothetical protein
MQGSYTLQASKYRSPDEYIRKHFFDELWIVLLHTLYLVGQIQRQVYDEVY